jgi:hypothetical protein
MDLYTIVVAELFQQPDAVNRATGSRDTDHDFQNLTPLLNLCSEFRTEFGWNACRSGCTWI